MISWMYDRPVFEWYIPGKVVSIYSHKHRCWAPLSALIIIERAEICVRMHIYYYMLVIACTIKNNCSTGFPRLFRSEESRTNLSRFGEDRKIIAPISCAFKVRTRPPQFLEDPYYHAEYLYVYHLDKLRCTTEKPQYVVNVTYRST